MGLRRTTADENWDWNRAFRRFCSVTPAKASTPAHNKGIREQRSKGATLPAVSCTDNKAVKEATDSIRLGR